MKQWKLDRLHGLNSVLIPHVEGESLAALGKRVRAALGWSGRGHSVYSDHPSAVYVRAGRSSLTIAWGTIVEEIRE